MELRACWPSLTTSRPRKGSCDVGEVSQGSDFSERTGADAPHPAGMVGWRCPDALVTLSVVGHSSGSAFFSTTIVLFGVAVGFQMQAATRHRLVALSKPASRWTTRQVATHVPKPPPPRPMPEPELYSDTAKLRPYPPRDLPKIKVRGPMTKST